MTKYNIISINEDRADYKQTIRKNVQLDEIHVPATDGREVDLSIELENRGLRLPVGYLSAGEVGIWLSTFDCWQWAVENNENLVVFEDDAIPTESFNALFSKFSTELPKTWGLLSLWVPDNQLPDYTYDLVYDEYGVPTNIGPNRNPFMSLFNYGAIRLARAYQGYGNVAIMYSPVGAQQLIDRARLGGIDEPIDVWVFCRAHTGTIEAFAPKPIWARAVTYDWKAETTVHNTERITL